MGRVGCWAHGVDLSPGMIEADRRRFPRVEFREGDLLRLPADDGEFGSAVALYSLIHLAPGALPAALAEAARVLRPEGLLLVGFRSGREVRHLDEWWGHPVDLDFRFLEPGRVAGQLEAAGFDVEMTMERRPHSQEAPTRRAYLPARRRT